MIYDVYRMRLAGVELPVKLVLAFGPKRGELWLYPSTHKRKTTNVAELRGDNYEHLMQYLKDVTVLDVEGKPGVLCIRGYEFKNSSPVLANWATWRQEWRCVPVPDTPTRQTQKSPPPLRMAG